MSTHVNSTIGAPSDARAYVLTADEMAAIMAALAMWATLAGVLVHLADGTEPFTLEEPERMIAAYNTMRRQLTAYGVPTMDLAAILADRHA